MLSLASISSFHALGGGLHGDEVKRGCKPLNALRGNSL